MLPQFYVSQHQGNLPLDSGYAADDPFDSALYEREALDPSYGQHSMTASDINMTHANMTDTTYISHQYQHQQHPHQQHQPDTMRHTDYTDQRFLPPDRTDPYGAFSTTMIPQQHDITSQHTSHLRTTANRQTVFSMEQTSQLSQLSPPIPTASLKRTASDPAESDLTDNPSVANSARGGRGRARHRLPHTAVERRYRENLNMHLDKLRLAVPSLSAAGKKRGDGEDAIIDVQKPSKCEILIGAVDYIKQIEGENDRLRQEVRWLRGGGSGQVGEENME